MKDSISQTIQDEMEALQHVSEWKENDYLLVSSSYTRGILI